MKNWPTLVCAASVLLFACNDSPCDPAVSNCGDGGGTDAGPVNCPALNGMVVTHANDISADETWAGDGTVHKWAFGATIKPGATLTVAGCAVVQMGAGLSMTVRGAVDAGMQAHLVTKGTATQPVLFTNVPGSGPWGNINTFDENASMDLAYTTFENGGGGTYHGGAIDLKAGADPSTTTVPVLRVDHVTIKGAAGAGLTMETGSGFTPDSTELTVTGGGKVTGNPGSAIEIGLIPLGTLPTLHVSGNSIDQIMVTGTLGGALEVKRDLTIKGLGVPYYLYFDRVSVYDPTGTVQPTLTIEPGVELRFDDYLMVGFTNEAQLIDRIATLHAVGTAAQPIVFTSSKPTPAAGDWPGVWLRNANNSVIQYASINFAGAPNGIVSANCKPPNSSDNAALMIGEHDSAYIPSPSQFVSVSISDSAAHGINAMWPGLVFGPDLTPAFTFTRILNGCSQTKNEIIGGTCLNGQTGCLVQ